MSTILGKSDERQHRSISDQCGLDGGDRAELEVR